ncbi:hypothetical protein Tco_1095842 [Tanacetum coccineum]
MAERTMEELLRAPTEGYGEAIVLPEINADHFEIKTNLLQLVQASPFHGYERENPHAHITLRFRDEPNDVIKLMMFPYSLEGAAKVWYEKEPPNSILTWEDLDLGGSQNEKPRRQLIRSNLISKEVSLTSHLRLIPFRFRNPMFRRLHLSRIFYILRDVMIKSPVTKLLIKWRRSFKSFKIFASTLASRMLYF